MTDPKILNVAIVGAGPGGKAIMDMILAKRLRELPMNLVGVADIDPTAVGYVYARQRGFFTTDDWRRLYEIDDLDLVIEVTGDEALANEISFIIYRVDAIIIPTTAALIPSKDR